MDMKKILLIGIFLASLFAQQSGKELFEANCMACHATKKPQNKKDMTAPAIMGVMYHVKQRYPNKADAVRFIVDYVKNPSPQKALCPSVKRFGLMPKLDLDDKTLTKIAEYIYDNYPPQGFKHPKGKGMGMKRMGMFN